MSSDPGPLRQLIPLVSGLGFSPREIARVFKISESSVQPWIQGTPAAPKPRSDQREAPGSPIPLDDQQACTPAASCTGQLREELRLMVRYLPDDGVVGLRAGWIRERIGAYRSR